MLFIGCGDQTPKWLPSSPKGGDCWHYVACVVLDGNSLVEEQVYGN